METPIYCVGILLFSTPHNHDISSDLILSVMKDFNMSTKMKVVTFDSSGEMWPAMIIVRHNLNDQYFFCLEYDFYIWCVCHIINCVVCDVTQFIKKKMQMLRQILKSVCCYPRQIFRSGCCAGCVEVPSVNVERRWNFIITIPFKISSCSRQKRMITENSTTIAFWSYPGWS